MNRSAKNKKFRQKLVLALVLGATGVVVISFGLGNYGWIKMLKLHKRQAYLKRQIIVSLAHNEILKREIRLVQENRLFIEALVRENLGMVRPGEVSYRFYSSDSLKGKR
ncbi:septum formation initiator family protein [candidate division TA06 bacterium]|uniref:Septum formation initiator family protein n=1 Tax=candidate division TA06 bacterium TaxID=2250710 RepID=A0A933IB12_UNCT6|nr:septum formation initiator family protein [candidate division TA06 bacterium]